MPVHEVGTGVTVDTFFVLQSCTGGRNPNICLKTCNILFVSQISLLPLEFENINKTSNSEMMSIKTAKKLGALRIENSEFVEPTRNNECLQFMVYGMSTVEFKIVCDM